MTDHLQEAKEYPIEYTNAKTETEVQLQVIAHAVIAIAEQLEKMSGGVQTDTRVVRQGVIDIFGLCESIPDGCEDAKALDELVTKIHSKADEILAEFVEED